MDVPEVALSILSFLDCSSDLIAMACVSKRFTDMALSLLWQDPDFPGDPLFTMAGLFTDEIRAGLLEGTDESMLVHGNAFGRFDYYAKFVRHLRHWQVKYDGYIARVLALSRPGTFVFPELRSIHYATAGDSVSAMQSYLSPTLRTVRLDHWDSTGHSDVTVTPAVTAVLLQVLRLPNLRVLDFLDSVYLAYEAVPEVVQALCERIPNLTSFHSSNFTLLRTVYDALSISADLSKVFLDFPHHHDDKATMSAVSHYPKDDIITMLRNGFPVLNKITTQSDCQTAESVLSQADHQFRDIELRVDDFVGVAHLGKLARSMSVTIDGLRNFCCMASESTIESDQQMMVNALAPMKKAHCLEKVDVKVGFCEGEMLSDSEASDLIGEWPLLQSLRINSHHQLSDLARGVPYSTVGLTLETLVVLQRLCPHLHRVSLSFVDFAVIPLLVRRHITKAYGPMCVSFNLCHTPDQPAVVDFVKQLWPNAEVFFRDCCVCTELHAVRHGFAPTVG